MLRWLDELNGVTDAESKAREIRTEIKQLRGEPNSVQNRRRVRQLYGELDKIQFKPDYLCVIIDKEKDYHRACKGFSINGLKYERLLGTNGGVKNETIVFISERHAAEIRRRIDNGRNMEMPMVPAKLEAYKALTCSASIPVSMPKGVLVVNDCETDFVDDIIYLTDEQDGEPVMEKRDQAPIHLNVSDGCGIMLPSIAKRWSEELGLDYIASGVNMRFSWGKGMLFPFDFVEFAEKVAHNYIVKDAWGNEVDVRDVEVMLTTSMVKLWDSYDSCESYLRNSIDNHYTFSVTKTCPRELEATRNLNYQFIQSYDLGDEDIEELISPTLEEIREILHANPVKTVLYLKGTGLTQDNIERAGDDFVKALMIDPGMIADPYIQNKVYQMIRNRINEAKVGVLKVHGNYSIVSGDPYSICQSAFGLPVTGLLKAGEIYNRYWHNQGAERLACFRAPMTCHNNIRLVVPHHSAEAEHWYQYMNTCTIFNSWDTAAAALNGMDFDGDLVMLTDNPVLVRKLRPLPALMCAQRKADKKIVSERDAIQANIDSFGDDIGKTTNWITSMFEVRARFDRDSYEYKELEYRIMCGQLYQQNAIDKAKGIVCKPMPRTWHDRHVVNVLEDGTKKRFYLNIVADKKPYFMRYIYPALSKQYNTYIRNTNKNSLREFQITVDGLRQTPQEARTDRQSDFLRYYAKSMPVGTSDCVMNKICRRFEEEFDGYISKHSNAVPFDYAVLKSRTDYSKAQFNSIRKLYEDYNQRLKNYAVFSNYEHVDEFDSFAKVLEMNNEFIAECTKVCPNRFALCDIILDICYQRSSTKRFAWEMCGGEIIQNLLDKHRGEIAFPTADQHGDISFCGKKFSLQKKVLEGWNGHCPE